MNDKDLEELLKKFREGTLSAEEKALVENWMLFGEFKERDLSEAEIEEELEKLGKRLPIVEKTRRLWLRIAAAASILLISGIGVWFFFAPRHPDTELNSAQVVGQDIAPGKQSATLTLANGKKIVLSSVSNEELEKQAGPNVAKTEGTLGYTVYPPLSALGATDDYHTLSTAKGETYRVGLPDGSIVWLNAESSLKYPASFVNRDKRNVTLRGEAYFEIARDKMHPFVVETDKQKVEVLGTHFNINAYKDHGQVRTTLLEGSVKVSTGKNNETILKPGQQSILANNSLKVSPANTEETVAWKNGYFRFNNEDIASIMSKLSRWYNIEVKFSDEVPTVGFYGTISRFKNISEVLEMLEQTKGVHFKIEGRRVTVMK
ncbi:MAG TPA: FecR domain-containing protein [Pedobacter sp.]|uniref:FecR family protein n=1 Tax=Pedobacter sp. TaxID=1411316 RepID=UPI002CFB5B3C|nr:FecR domain-containing protein [Pedobacter sp.]HMI01785.1 FecR domain-containing protein [Pedobacter sp.]